MNKYIIDLLKTESTVIIPEFGALMKTGRSLIFNPILKFNDGKLQKYIAKKEDRDEQDVANMIAKHVREIIADIGKGNAYRVFGLGEFYKNEEGKIVFKQEEVAPKETVPPTTEKVAVPKKEKEIVNKPDLKKDKPKEETEAPKEEKKETKPPVVTSTFLEQSIKEKEEVEPVKIEKKPTVEEKQEKVIPPIKTENSPKKVKNTPKKTNKEKKPKKSKKGVVIWSVIFVIIGGLGVFAGLNLEKIKGWVGISKTEVVENTETINKEEDTNTTMEEEEDMAFVLSDSTEEEILDEEEDTATTDKEEIEEELIEEEIEEPVQISKDKVYHITVGSFSDRSNAQALVEKMKKEGLPGARILNTGGSMAKVVAGSYATKEAAEKDIEKATKYNAEAYVIKVREN